MKYATSISSVVLVMCSSLCMAQYKEAPLDSLAIKLQSVTLMQKEDARRYGGERESFIRYITEEGDTLLVANLDNISVSAPRTFNSREDYLKYIRYRRYAAKVYPYAKEAIRIFSEAQRVSGDMKKRKRKKYLRQLAKELETEFEIPLKNLSKTQGKILVKMIERELDSPMYELIKMTQGSLKAFYWNQSSKLYGYRLKDGYTVGDNVLLDIVLQDFDISYDLSVQWSE